MRTVEHDLNSLRKLVRELQLENSRLKAILKDNQIAFEEEDAFQNTEIIDEYDEDQGSSLPRLYQKTFKVKFQSNFRFAVQLPGGRSDAYQLVGASLLHDGRYCNDC